MNTSQQPQYNPSNPQQPSLASTSDLPFQATLKRIYSQQDKIAPLIEGVIPEQSMKHYYIKLQTILKEDDDKKTGGGGYEGITGEKRDIDISCLFSKLEAVPDSQEAHKILLLGGAGVGKSTLMQYMAYRWSEGTIWNSQFDYVYRVGLKTILTDDWKARYVADELNDSELRCLAHYHLTATWTKAQRATLKTKDLTWTLDKARVLLLLDGYDEIAHLRTTEEYQDLFEEIFSHDNLILTSRPNAVDKDMKAKFDRKIENTGLDTDGVEQYLKLYFANVEEGDAKSGELQQFLKSNANIKEICKVPVNIAMLCYIWSESEEGQVLQRVTNMSDLYTQVVDQLGFRYYSKSKYKGVKQEGKDLRTQWETGMLHLDEIKILEHVAYKGMTGGGIEVPEEKRVETLIIRGAIDNRDKDGISIRSSINKLNPTLKDQHLGIEDVYRYGVLKTEGVVLADEGASKDSAKLARDKATDDTKLNSQNYTFIHLTFQEYLTASYLKQKLTHGNTQDQEQVCQYIAEHRNEPRYLMTLKFLAGVITADRSQEGDAAARMFWEAVTCNVDGVLELGVESKVTLLMHLLSQARGDATGTAKNEGIDNAREADARIPNKQVMTSLIDIVVLQNLTSWGGVLQEADYMTDTIKEVLQEAFYHKFDCKKRIRDILSKAEAGAGGEAFQALKTAVEKVAKTRVEAETLIRSKTRATINEDDTAHDLRQKDGGAVEPDSRVLVIISSLISKYSHDEQEQFTHYLVQIVADSVKFDWQVTKVVIESLTKIISSVKVNQKYAEELVKLLSELLDDSNLGGTSAKAMKTLVKLKNDGINAVVKEVLNKMSALITHEDPHVRDSACSKAVKIIMLIPTPEAVYLALDKISLLLADTDSSVAYSACRRVAEVLKLSPSGEVVRSALDKINPLLANPNIYFVNSAYAGVEMLKVSQSAEAVQLALDKITPVLADSNLSIRKNACQGIIEIVKSVPSPETVQSAINKLTPLLADRDRGVRRSVCRGAVEILKLGSSAEVVQLAFIKIVPLLADDDPDVSKSACQGVVEMLKLSWSPEAVELALTNITPLLTHMFMGTRMSSEEGIIEILKINPTAEAVRSVFDKITPILRDYSTGQLILEIKRLNLGPEAVQSVINALTPLLADPGSDSGNATKYFACWNIIEMLQRGLRPEAVQSGLDKLTPLFVDPSWSVKNDTFKGVTKILKLNPIPEAVQSTLNTITSLLAHPDKKVRGFAYAQVVEIVNLSPTLEAKQSVLDRFTALLADPDSGVKSSACEGTTEIFKLSPSAEAARSTLETITLLLADADSDVRSSACRGIAELVKLIPSAETVQSARDKITPLLADQSSDVKSSACRAVAELVKLSLSAEAVQPALNSIAPLLADPDVEVNKCACNGVSEILKLSPSPHTVQWALDKIIPLLADPRNSGRDYVYLAIKKVLKLSPSDEAVQSTLDRIIPRLADPDPEGYKRDLVYDGIARVLELSTSGEAVQSVLDAITPLLADPEFGVRLPACLKIPQMVKLIPNPEAVKSALNTMTSLLTDKDNDVRDYVYDGIIKILELDPSCEAVQSALNKIIPLLADPDSDLRGTACSEVAKILKINPSAESVQSALDAITLLLADPINGLRRSACVGVAELLKLGSSPKTV